MAFMKGFGTAFSETFNQRQKIDAIAEQDAFAAAYESYVAKQKQYDVDKKTHEDRVRQAQNMVKRNPHINPNAWTHAVELLEDGYTIEQTENKLLTTKFADIPTADPAPMPDTMDTQMQGTGMVPTTPQPADLMSTDPTTSAAPPPAAALEPPTMGNNPFTNIGKNVQNKIAQIGNPAAQREALITGATEKTKGIVGEGYDDVMKGYTPEPVTPMVTIEPQAMSPLAEWGLEKGPLTDGDLRRIDAETALGLKSDDPEIKGKALKWLSIREDLQTVMEESGGGGVDANGQPMLNPELEARIATIVGNDKPFQDLAAKKGFVMTFSDDVQQMSNLLVEFPELNTMGAKASSTLDAIKNNSLSLLALGEKLIGGTTDVAGYLDSVFENAASNIDGWKELTAAERQFQAQILRVQYNYARGSMDQSSTAQSNADIANMREIIINSTDAKAIVDGFKRLVLQDANAYNKQAEALMGNPFVDTGIAMQEQAYGSGKSRLKNALGPIPAEKLKWATSTTPDTGSTDDADPLAEEMAPIENPTPEQMGEFVRKGKIDTPEKLKAIQAEAPGKEWKMGDTFTEYANGYWKD